MLFFGGGEIRKILGFLGVEKMPYLELRMSKNFILQKTGRKYCKMSYSGAARLCNIYVIYMLMTIHVIS